MKIPLESIESGFRLFTAPIKLIRRREFCSSVCANKLIMTFALCFRGVQNGYLLDHELNTFICTPFTCGHLLPF